MARTRTLAQMRLQARTHADAVYSQNTTDAEANVWINQSLALLWGKLTKLDARRFKRTVVLTTDGSALEYDFTDGTRFSPTAGDLQSLLGVDWMNASGRYPLSRFDFNDRGVGSLLGPGSMPVYGSTSSTPRYAIEGQGIDGSATRLVFDRAPAAGSYEVHYIQAPPELVVDTDAFDGVAGFEEWAVLRVAIMIATREESDTSALVALWKDTEPDISALGAERDAGQAEVPAKVWGRRSRGRGGIGRLR
ncbi:MAG: hypothetical protein KC501_41025 [Myxococcales bacterium]|nr:hypothetical protein [Myxococcales bacterium]